MNVSDSETSVTATPARLVFDFELRDAKSKVQSDKRTLKVATPLLLRNQRTRAEHSASLTHARVDLNFGDIDHGKQCQILVNEELQKC